MGMNHYVQLLALSAYIVQLRAFLPRTLVVWGLPEVLPENPPLAAPEGQVFLT